MEENSRRRQENENKQENRNKISEEYSQKIKWNKHRKTDMKIVKKVEDYRNVTKVGNQEE